jgi:protein-S-isoprenylcysteine O-methyltransferase Ste14
MRSVIMVPDAATLLCAVNLLIVAALPRVFFRRGRLNADWWFTAAPFALAGAALVLATVGVHTFAAAPAWPWLRVLAVPAAAASILLIGVTLGTHREPVSLWHQPNDTPARLVTHGAYARIRHPFYAAFLLALTACVLVVPGPLTATAFVWAAIQLTRTARREESRLLASSFGGEYAEYMDRTGRFVP